MGDTFQGAKGGREKKSERVGKRGGFAPAVLVMIVIAAVDEVAVGVVAATAAATPRPGTFSRPLW